MPKTIKLDAFRYITNEGWRALIAIEMGMKNHEIVPIELAQKISRCKRNGAGFIKLFKDHLLPYGLVAYESDGKKCAFGYRLTNLGYDYLALHQLVNSQQLSSLGSMIGAGKESDVYLGTAGALCGQSEDENCLEPAICEGTPVVIKFHRLGRTSFRKVKDKREYHLHRSSCSWLYLDRLASQREFSMMKALHFHNLPVPVALAHNRNAVVMSYVDNSVPLSRVLPSSLRAGDSFVAKRLYNLARDMLHRMASVGLIHGDLNEFNLMVVGLNALEQDQTIYTSSIPVDLVLIDFPQMISRDHRSAPSIYQRDADGIVSFFSRYFNIPDDQLPMDLNEVRRTSFVDVEVKAPGFLNEGRTAHRDRRFTKDILLGSTLKKRSSESGDSSQYEESDCSGTDVSTCEDSISESDDSTAPDEDGVKIIEKKIKKTKVTEREPHGLINQEEIRARHMRERRKKEQTLFQQQIKRHGRARVKRQNRASINAELTLFD